MDRLEPRELLSAYLDGEVTPAERAEAERLLESSPELRGELDDFARLSDLIRGLPRESAPADLAPAIRQQAAQQSLLRPEPAVAPRSLRREIVSALIGMAVTAAGMLLMLQTAERHQGHLAQTGNPPAGALAANRDEQTAVHSVDPGMEAASNRDAATVASRTQPGQLPADSPSANIATGAALAPPAPSLAKSGMMKTSVEPAEPEMAKAKTQFSDGSVAGFAGGLGAMDADAGNGMNRNGMNWSAVRIGDVVPYLERSGNGVAVVELTVVDINDAADQMEVLLERYHLPVLQDGAAASDKQRSVEQKSDALRGKKAQAADASELITVYVEGPSSDLTQFLNDMDEQQVFLVAQLQPPVDLPTLNDNEKLAELADRDSSAQDLSAKEAEQIVKQEAAEATNQYVANRFLNTQGPTAAGENAGNLAQKPGSTSQLRRMTGASQTARAMANADRKQTSPQAKKDFDAEGPADALAAVHPQGQAMINYRQRSAVAIQNTVNPSQGLWGSSLAAGKTANSVAEKAASNLSVDSQRESEALKRDKESEQDAAAESLADEPVPTVRLLFVLQQAAPAGPPRE